MTLLSQWVQSNTASALGWTLVHSLWEGALIALVLAAVLGVSRSSRVRYAAACVAMLLLLVAVSLTFALLLPPPHSDSFMVIEVRDLTTGSDITDRGDPVEGMAEGRLTRFLPWLTPFWAAGVLIFQLRTLTGWLFAQRLGRRGVCCPPEVWQSRLDTLGASLRISRPVRLLESCLAEVPVVLGHLRPLILMPVGLLANLPVAQVESILLHELAHIRRYDYFVNLMQTSVEGLLFYHPALWWISSVIRAERENCCDDLVVAIRGDAHQYAAALAALEQSRWALREAALAATGGRLLNRIRRLLGQPDHSVRLAPVFSAGVLTVVAAVTLAAWQVKPVPPAAQVRAVETADPAYDRWLNEDVTYIIKDEERSFFKHLQTNAEREKFIEEFWARRDPTPSTIENEFKKEHYRRIGYANQRYVAGGVPGWKTDRGRMYITFGPPDEIEAHPSGSKYQRPGEQGGGVTVTFPFEKWLYRNIPGVGQGVVMEFVDRSGAGEYRMTSDPAGNIFLSAGPGAPAYVSVTPERRVTLSIPLDFEAKQYSIALTVRTADGQSRWKSSSVVSVCKYSLQAAGCLSQPVFASESGPLEPGSYALEAIVSDGSGLINRTYSVTFSVN